MLKIFYCSKQWTIVLPIVLSKDLSLSMLIDVILIKKRVHLKPEKEGKMANTADFVRAVLD